MASELEAAAAASDSLATVLRGVRLAPEPADVRLVCADGPDRLRVGRDTIAARLPGCARDLPLSAYLELSLAGAASVHLVRGPCCAEEDEPAAMADARALVGRHGLATELACASPPRRWGRARPVVAAASLPLPRRAVLAPWLLTQLPLRARDERDRLLDTLRVLGEPVPTAPDDAPATLASPPPPAFLLAASGCTACGVCVRACPAQALRLEPTGTGQVLTEEVAECTACGECVRLCPESALSSTGTATWRDVRERTVLTLATVGVEETCRRCGQPIAQGTGQNGFCPVCAYRRANPFGSRMPPGGAAG